MGRHTDTSRSSDIDEARLLPHLRAQKPKVYVAPDNGTNYTQTLQLSAQADPGDLRGIPVIARGVGGTSPHTNPEAETIARDQRRKRAA